MGGLGRERSVSEEWWQWQQQELVSRGEEVSSASFLLWKVSA